MLVSFDVFKMVIEDRSLLCISLRIYGIYVSCVRSFALMLVSLDIFKPMIGLSTPNKSKPEVSFLHVFPYSYVSFVRSFVQKRRIHTERHAEKKLRFCSYLTYLGLSSFNMLVYSEIFKMMIA